MPKKLTYDEVKTYIEKQGDTLISKNYVNSKTKMEIQCKNNHIFKMTFHDYKGGCRCSECYNNKRIVTKEYVEKYLGEYGYKLNGEYKNTQEKIKIICPNNHNIEMAFCQFKSNGHRCRYCSNNNIKHDYEYIKKTLEDNGYTLNEKEYKNNTQKLSMICSNGHEIKMSWTLFKMGVRCQQCNGSSGENAIAEILSRNKISYIYQHTFKDCKDKKVLPFDFYLPDYNICLEYDGEQHYKPFEYFGGEDGFNIRKKHDNIKEKYCKDNNIKLIRVPYWDFDDMENIIINNLH